MRASSLPYGVDSSPPSTIKGPWERTPRGMFWKKPWRRRVARRRFNGEWLDPQYEYCDHADFLRM